MRGVLVVLVLAIMLVGCSVDDPRRAPDKANAPLTERLARADLGQGEVLFRQCAACHTIGRGTGDRDGPALYGVLGRPVGRGSPRFAYTAALQAKGGVWTQARMDAWLASPQRFAPGTKMLFPGLPNGTDRADVIAYLRQKGP